MRKTKTPQAPEGGGPLGRETPRYVHTPRGESHALEDREADGTRAHPVGRPLRGLGEFGGGRVLNKCPAACAPSASRARLQHPDPEVKVPQKARITRTNSRCVQGGRIDCALKHAGSVTGRAVHSLIYRIACDPPATVTRVSGFHHWKRRHGRFSIGLRSRPTQVGPAGGCI
jgi:hypothetical protein